MGDTAKVIPLRGRKRTELHGDPSRKLESAEHIVTFPGGSIAVTRTSDGEYWAHVDVYRPELGPVLDDGRCSAHGEIVSARLDAVGEPVTELDSEGVYHLAVRIRRVS